jgi:hypothetical protein
MSYSPYNELKSIYDAKVAWGNATTDEERQRLNNIANEARKKLEAYDYGYLANQVSAEGADATAVKKVLDSWAPKVDTVTGEYKTGSNNPAYNKVINSASDKNDSLNKMATGDHDTVNSKYLNLFDYANGDVTQTAEYKSAFENMMPGYKLAAMQGRDSEVASGAASNGGNIDSFAAANAMRQQAALTAKGQQFAHQAGLEAYQAHVQNAKSILSDLGVYNSGVYSTLDKTVNNDLNIANNIFNNEQTAKNNDVANAAIVAETTGVVPTSMLYQLPQYSQFFNPDGTLKNPDGIDFKAEIAKADAAGNTRLAEALRVARGTKIWGDYAQYGQFDDGDYTLPGDQITESRREFDEKVKQADRLSAAESDDKEKDREHESDMLKLRSSLGVTGDGEPTKESKAVAQSKVDDTISNWLYSPKADLDNNSTAVYNNGDPSINVVYYAAKKINDPNVLPWIKESLANAGFDVSKKIAEYRDNIAKQILKAEGIPTTDPEYATKLAEVKNRHNLN